jgi:hypothetical protein
LSRRARRGAWIERIGLHRRNDGANDKQTASLNHEEKQIHND